MSRGITETDVWQACDALLLEGARPTIERVRQKIGRGSPNTVSPHLDAWFKNLGARIKDPGAFSAPPAIPAPIQQAAKHFWEAALAETRKDFADRLRDGMAAAVTNVEAEKERAAVAEAAAFDAASKMVRLQSEHRTLTGAMEREGAAKASSEVRLDDALRHAAGLQTRLDDLQEKLAVTFESSKREIAAALERSAFAERRTALEIDGERTARAKGDKRAEALERRLQTAEDEARMAVIQYQETTSRLQAEATQSLGEAKRAEGREAAQTTRIGDLIAALGEAEREAQDARVQAALAERLLTSLRPASTVKKRKPPSRVQQTDESP